MFPDKGMELLNICQEKNIPIWEYAIMCEQEESELSRDEIIEKMRANIKIMKEAAEYGLTNETNSISGLIGGDALKLNRYASSKNTLTGEFMVKAMARSVSCSEVNATMAK